MGIPVGHNAHAIPKSHSIDKDDLTGEAKELHAIGNGWFAYTPLLHRIREGVDVRFCHPPVTFVGF